MSPGLVIVDRDGVINHDSPDFIRSPDEWIPIPGSLEAIARLCAAGFSVAVASNQSGIGRKLIDPPALEAINNKMRKLVSEAGGDIVKIVYCPHHPDDACHCRKPMPGMLLEISRYLGVPLAGVPVVGDSARDLEAARAAGAWPVLVLTGNGERTAAALRKAGEQVDTYADLAAVADGLIATRRSA